MNTQDARGATEIAYTGRMQGQSQQNSYANGPAEAPRQPLMDYIGSSLSESHSLLNEIEAVLINIINKTGSVFPLGSDQTAPQVPKDVSQGDALRDQVDALTNRLRGVMRYAQSIHSGV